MTTPSLLMQMLRRNIATITFTDGVKRVFTLNENLIPAEVWGFLIYENDYTISLYDIKYQRVSSASWHCIEEYKEGLIDQEISYEHI